MTGSRGRLIAYRADRLGARLVSLVNAMRLAEDLCADFGCAWMGTSGVGHVFNDPAELFERGFVERHFLTEACWRALRPTAMTLSAHPAEDAPGLASIVNAGSDIVVGNAFGVIVLPGEDRGEVAGRFRAQFARIPFAPAVHEAMAELDQRLDGWVAYHIRRGDLTGDLKAMNKPWPHKVVPDEFYERHMAHELGRGASGVVLFSDDRDTISRFRQRFPQLRTVGDLIDTRGLTEAQSDLLELYAMSRAATIVAPERSAFSSTAADLGGARKVSVTGSITPALADDAHEALLRRLSERPGSFSGDGEIGQALAHVGSYLERQGRFAEAAQLFARHVRRGLNISFVYPLTMHHQHRSGDVDGVLATARAMSERQVVHVKDFAAAEFLHGYAHLRRGDRPTAVHCIVNGFWQAPGAPMARLLVPVLLHSGLLNETNFLPVSALQLRLQRRRGPLKVLHGDFPELTALPGVEVPETVGSLEIAAWDWAPLIPAVSLAAADRRGVLAQAAKQLARMKPAGEDDAERAGLLAMLRAYRGEPDAAAEELNSLAQKHDAHAMTWQRLSHARLLMRKFGKAADAAARAAEIAPHIPAMRAWAGMICLRVRDPEGAAAHLAMAHAAIRGAPMIAGLLAQALDRLGRSDEAMAMADRALALAPVDVAAAMLRAKLLDEAGRTEDAAGTLQRLVECERAPAKVFLTLIDMLQKLGHRERRQATIRLARRRIPNHPAIADLAGAG